VGKLTIEELIDIIFEKRVYILAYIFWTSRNDADIHLSPLTTGHRRAAREMTSRSQTRTDGE
jgi:hypothetical protein